MLPIRYAPLSINRFFVAFIYVQVVEKLGMQHVKGILLYGPPDTGKMLMPRKIGQLLNGREPKVFLCFYFVERGC